MLDAAEYYIKKEGLMVLEENQKVHLAINRLGLATISPFNPKYEPFLCLDKHTPCLQGENHRVLSSILLLVLPGPEDSDGLHPECGGQVLSSWWGLCISCIISPGTVIISYCSAWPYT